jgi:hypothetical protein
MEVFFDGNSPKQQFKKFEKKEYKNNLLTSPFFSIIVYEKK